MACVMCKKKKKVPQDRITRVSASATRLVAPQVRVRAGDVNSVTFSTTRRGS